MIITVVLVHGFSIGVFAKLAQHSLNVPSKIVSVRQTAG
jgi:hypothetical protein